MECKTCRKQIELYEVWDFLLWPGFSDFASQIFLPSRYATTRNNVYLMTRSLYFEGDKPADFLVL